MYQMFCKLKLARLLQLTKTKLRCEKTLVPINDKAKTKQTFDIRKKLSFTIKWKCTRNFLFTQICCSNRPEEEFVNLFTETEVYMTKSAVCVLIFIIKFLNFPHIEGLE